MRRKISILVLIALCFNIIPVNAVNNSPTIEYDASWGANLPQKITKSEKTTNDLDVLVLEYVKEGGYYSKKRDNSLTLPCGILAMYNIFSSLYNLTDKNRSFDSKLSHYYDEVYKPYISAIRTADGKKMNISSKGLNWWSEAKDAYDKADIGDVVFTVEVKVKPLKLEKYLQLKEIMTYDLINTTTIQPGLSGSLSESITGGVSSSESYTFAKTVGSSTSISAGAELANSNVGGLSASYTKTMSEQISKVHQSTFTVNSEQTKSVNISRNNTSDKVEVLGLYQRRFGFMTEYVDDVYVKYGKEKLFNKLKSVVKGEGLTRKDFNSYAPLTARLAPQYTYKDIYYETVLGSIEEDLVKPPTVYTPSTTTISIKPSHSTYVKWGSNMKHVYNSPRACYIYESNASSKNSQTGFLKFNLKKIIGKKIVSAKLEYTIRVGKSTLISIVEDVDASNWAESRLNGNEAKHFDVHNKVVYDKRIHNSGRYSEDITWIIQDFAYRGDVDDNLTFRIYQPRHSNWTSIDGRTSKNPPKLIIKYQD